MIVIPGPSSKDLGSKIASLTRAKIVPIVFKRFPDGESYIRFEGEVKGEHVVIVQSSSPPQDTSLVQAFLMVNTAKDLGAERITLVMPYLAYARQDKRFLKGEALSLNVVLSLLKNSGVDELITVNSHNSQALMKSELRCRDLSAIPLLAEYFKNKGLAESFSLAPGKKREAMAIEADRILKGGFGYLDTRRDPLTGKVIIEERDYGVSNRTVIIFDDIISTGGTMMESVKMVKKQGAREVYVACVHPLLIGDSMERILASGAIEIVGTDTVQSPVSVVSVAPIIANYLVRE